MCVPLYHLLVELDPLSAHSRVSLVMKTLFTNNVNDEGDKSDDLLLWLIILNIVFSVMEASI